MAHSNVAPLPPPIVTPSVREPHWQVLVHDLNWVGLWSSGAVAEEVARLEARLHNTAITDHLDMIATRARLDAYRWLRETVTALAAKANQREADVLAEATTVTRRSRWRRAGDAVLPPVLG